MSDAWEMDHFGSTTSVIGGAWADYDGDGLCNFFESQAGTDPTNAASVLAVAGISPSDGSDTVLSWRSVSGRFYRVSSATNMGAGLTNVTAEGVRARPPMNTRTVDVGAARTRFYRVGLD